MNPWSAKNYKKTYDNFDLRTGIALRFEKGVHGDIKLLFTDFAKWLRKNYHFPIRVTVYVKESETITLMNGSVAWGAFRYFDTFDEPYIRIPTGDYLDRAKIEGDENAAYTILSSFVHELTHYFQWVNQFEQTEEKSERQANYYRNRIIDLYLSDRRKPITMTYNERKEQVKSYLGKTVKIKIDRPIGYVHKKSAYSLTYPINYGYIPGVLGGDGEELDVYLLGVNEPVKEYECEIIAIAHRHNDVEDKLVAAPEGIRFTKAEIEKAVAFQEQYYISEIEVF